MYSFSSQSSMQFSMHSSSLVTLNRPHIESRLKITSRAFHHTAPVMWTSPPDLHHQTSHSASSQPNQNLPLHAPLIAFYLSQNAQDLSLSFFFVVMKYLAQDMRGQIYLEMTCMSLSLHLLCHFGIIHLHLIHSSSYVIEFGCVRE
jgi:hypothetical protein